MKETTSKYEYLGQRIAQLARLTPAHPTSAQIEEFAERWYQLMYEFHGSMPDSGKRRLFADLREALAGVLAEEV